MENYILLTIYNTVENIILFSIITVYGLATFWNIKFLIITKWQIYSNIKLLTCIACILFFFIFGYAFIGNIFGNPVDAGIFGTALVRPTILLMGGAIASGARARITSLKRGGENWILRN